jgi:hypothetical protein
MNAESITNTLLHFALENMDAEARASVSGKWLTLTAEVMSCEVGEAVEVRNISVEVQCP